jgi:glycine oxidase
MSRQHTTDVVIAGGGVIGCSIAYQLGKAGAEVIVVEREEVAAEASSAAAGLLAPIGEISGQSAYANLLLASWSLYPELIPTLEEASGVRAEYYCPGSLHTATNAADTGLLRRQMATWGHSACK